MITVVGLGVEKGDLTRRGERAILSGERVVLKTALTKSAESVLSLGVDYIALDSVYERSRSFSTLNKNLAKAVVEEEKKGNVVYCVDGSAQEDNSVKLLLKRKNIEIVDGVSKASAIASAAKLTACSYLSLSAYDVSDYKRRTLPLIVYDIDNDFIAGDVKLALCDLIGEETQVKFIRDGKVSEIKLYELDRQGKYDYTCALVAEESPLTERKRFDLVDLQDIIVRLRRPDGCPWDKVQTPESIKTSPVEEAYELMEAVNLKDDGKILEETGDILLQSVFYAVMKEEEDAFTLSDVLTAECEKMITRHTHIFGKDHANSEAEALNVWERNKMAEKRQKSYSEAVNDVPNTFPALLRAQKVAKRMAKGGWSLQDIDGRRLGEEAEEFLAAYRAGDSVGCKEKLGDLLMTLVQWARTADIDAEETLLDTVEKVKKRFRVFENLALADGKDPAALSEEERKIYCRRARESCE